jgi:hypothetical protein
VVVLYANVGLYKNLKEILDIFDKHSIISILIVDNEYLTSSLLELFSDQKLGGVVWNFGENFWDKHLDEVLNEDLPADPWYFSWFLENRYFSTPEYHLDESQDVFEELLESFYYLYLDKFLKGNPFSFFFKELFVYTLKYKKLKPKEAREKVINSYKKVLNFAVPDVVFDLQLNVPKCTQKLILNY